MEETESFLNIDDHDIFRKDVMARIAAWAIGHKDIPPDLNLIFAKERKQIVQGLFDERRQSLTEALTDTLTLLDDGPEKLAESRQEAAARTLSELTDNLGYQPASAEEAIRHYLQEQS